MPFGLDPVRKRLAVLGGALILALGLVILLFSQIAPQRGPVPPDSRFVLTTVPSLGLPVNPNLRDRVFFWFFKMNLAFRSRHPRPLAYTFSAGPVTRCSIHGLLNQCMEVTGMCFMIPKDVAGGTVPFGNTNVLNGEQWTRAFTEALKNGEAEWWDSKEKRFRREELVLLTNTPRTVLVLPREMRAEFRK